MIALEINKIKEFMNILLVSTSFDAFLVEEVEITTFNTFVIDCHIVKDFFTSDELEILCDEQNDTEFSSWKDIRSVCFELIKGKKAPVSFKVVFHASHKLIEKIASNPECNVALDLIRSLAVNIRYDKGKASCITGTAFTTFVMDKSVERIWDNYVKQAFTRIGIDFTQA